jgi:beta-glucosidase
VGLGRAGAVTAGGTTILAAIRAAAPRATVTHSMDGAEAEGADIGIAVVGELPYAEGVGDRADLALSDQDTAVVARMKAAGLQVVVIVLSGRPLILGPALEQADALLAAWLPGTEGAGVADVLFGEFAPTGKLSVSWPRSMRQQPINVGDADYDPQFEYGFGLSY